MTIKEIESLSGMTRANIRFYETEGFLMPERRENGYRVYSERDLEMLKKIQLLRMLRFSLDEIKRLQAGEQSMDSVLAVHLEKLQAEEQNLRLSRQICEAMRSNGVTFGTMDAQRYLDVFSQKSRPDSTVPDTDTVPRVQMPWRRYFARILDLFFYVIAWNALLALVWNVNLATRPRGMRIFDNVMEVLLMLVLEPLQLRWFGTTFGKWILGLHVTDNDGNRLSLREAFSRTWGVFFYGMGLHIPLISLYRGWKSYRSCVNGETLQWEYESEISLKDNRGWRVAAYIGAYVLIFVALFFSIAFSMLPKNRGDISVAQFSENYNQQVQYYEYYSPRFYLDEEGHWKEVHEYEPNVVYVDAVGHRPEFVYSETDGIMTGLSFSVEQHGKGQSAYLYHREMIYCLYAFVCAQKGLSPFSKEVKALAKEINEMNGEGFACTIDGIEIICEVSYSGLYPLYDNGFLFPIGEYSETTYSFHFSMQKQGTSS